MKRLVAVLSSLLILPAFAEVAPLYYDEAIEYSGEEFDAWEEAPVVEEEVASQVVAAPVVPASRANLRGTSTSGRAASRAVPVSGAKTITARTTTSRNTGPASRATVARSTTAARTPVTRAVATRSARPSRGVGAATQIATTRRAMQSGPAIVARASVTTNDTVNQPIYSGRVATRSSSAVRARIPTITATTDVATEKSVTDVAAVATSMDEMAQITDFCKAQYTQCMDNFCNVLDDNQGRCSCSKNLENYAETEAALKQATAALQDVAQQIQYIGLTGDEIETLFSETEAEEVMSGTTDNTALKRDLDRIKSLIVDVEGGSAASTETSGMNFDLSGLLDFNISSTGFDLSSLFGGSTANTNSISNQRGEQLYKTATSRCKKAVLTDCQTQGVDISIITNAYDLEIDKQCIAYERQLTDTNEEMSQTVRNAKSVLQRARLMVAQQKNQYDLRGCINALDSCMQDDFACGSDYENCLDPSGKYIVNGELVMGSTPGMANVVETTTGNVTSPVTDGVYTTWSFKKTGTDSSSTDLNAWGKDATLTDYITAQIDATLPATTSTDMAKYLAYKIGYNSDGKNYGMCMSVLNKCQDYTYKDGVYVANNDVINGFMQRTMTQIKAAQDEVLSEFAENCMADVMSCLGQNNFDEDGVTAKSDGSYSLTTQNKIAIKACNSIVTTCMSVNGITPEAASTAIKQYEWIANMYGVDEKTGNTN